MSSENENEKENEKKRKESPAREAERKRRMSVVAPEPASTPMFNFLESLFVEGWPQRISLHIARGSTGERVGTCLREIPYTAVEGQNPSKVDCVELTNQLLAIAQADCDALAKPALYVLLAWDFVRSDRAYARHLWRAFPTGMPTALDADRGNVGALDDEEGNALSTKLLLGLLNDERRDKRWMYEQSMNLISGVVETQTEELEKLRAQVNAGHKSQVEYMQATQAMLDNSSDRRIKAEWSSWKKEKLSLALDKAFGAAELLLPALTSGANSDGNPIQKLLASMSEDEGAMLFGELRDGRVTGRVFTADQFDRMMKLANTKNPDAADVSALASSITADQVENAKGILGLGRLIPLYKWLTAQTTNGAAVQ